MHPKDRMVLMILLSYALILLGLGVILFWILRNMCGLSHNEAQNYAILGIIFILSAAFVYIKPQISFTYTGRRPNLYEYKIQE